MSNLKDVKPKAIKIMLDKERTLLFDLNAFAELEEIYGSVEGAMEVLEKGSMKAIINMLWAGLVHEDETLTKKQVGAMLGIATLEGMTEQLMAALGEARPNTPVAGNPPPGNQ